MSSAGETHEIVDSLRIQWVKDGKVVYDSSKSIPNLGFPTKPLKFCPSCGSDVQPVIWICKCCGIRYVQQQDRNTGRIVVMTLPPEETETEQPLRKT